ncbi:MAG: PAS domain-containing protein [Alphaproteobacteria bacterium]
MPSESQAQIDTQSIVAAQAGPACVASADRTILVVNQAWRALNLPTPEEPGALPAQLAMAFLVVTHNNRIQHLGLTLDGPSVDGGEVSKEALKIEFTCLPIILNGEPAVMALGHDRSAARNLVGALVVSRQFHREMSMQSTDFGWRVDGSQRTTFAGERGIMDYRAEELIGTRITDLLDPQSRSVADRVFSAREPVSQVEIWLCAKSGTRHCFIISATPVFDEDGNWCGAQGDGREFTQEWERREEITNVRRSQRQVDAVLYSMRSEVDPEAILGAAVSATIDTGNLAACFIAKVDLASKSCAMELRASGTDSAQTRAQIEAQMTALLGLCEGVALHAEHGLVQATLGGMNLLLGPTSNKQEVNGVAVFARQVVEHESAETGAGLQASVWTEDDYRLMRAVTDQLGVALAQLELVRSLTRASAPDTLVKINAR